MLDATWAVTEIMIYRTNYKGFNYLCGTIKHAVLNRSQQETILKLYKVLAVPALLYGNECWTLTKQQLQQIESSEMRFLRSTGRYRTIDKKINTDIRQNLKIFSLGGKIKGIPAELL
jgi:hypothetical protein